MLLYTHGKHIFCQSYVKLLLLFLTLMSFQTGITQPDLALDGPRIRSSMSLSTLFLSNNNNNNCYINEGCISGTGNRTLLRFTTKILNVGNQDFYVGPPPANPSLENETWEWDECHRHWHYEGYARYLLYDENGNQTDVGFKNGFCLIDIQCTSGSHTYTCSNQGISAGCADIYDRNLDCQWIDLTPIPSGRYQLVVEVNWDRSPDANGRVESSYSNNFSSVCFDYENRSGFVPSITVLDNADCENTGCTDSDNDGVCNEEDCQPNNPNRPTTPGTTCNDNDSATINDVIQSDGCTCMGEPSNGGGECADLTATTGEGSITVSGFAAFANYNVQVFTNNWQSVKKCVNDCTNPLVVSNLQAGDYRVLIKTFNTNWQTQCDESIIVTVSGSSCADSDNDGVCNADDCEPNNPNRPTTPNTACNDGDPDTTNDVILADGCTCRGTTDGGCTDSDNDGVCNEDDCQPNNPNRPTNPGTSCNDNNPDTVNDVIQNDGCTCRGTSTGGGSCDDITITGGESGITIDGFSSFPNHNIQIWTSGWAPTANCVNNCPEPYNLNNISTGTYRVSVKTFDANWQSECDVFKEVSVGGSNCPDRDNDGICDDDDCAPRNPDLPTTPGTACDDGDPNTINDVIRRNGCTCRGDLDGCTDSDNDGYCDSDDCAPNDPDLPTTVGSVCDDGDANTSNDVIQSDGCTCSGTPDTGGCNITVTTAPGQLRINGLNGAHTGMKVYNPSWQEIYNCNDDCNSSVIINNLSAGVYYVDAKNFTAGWSIDCRTNDYFTVPAASNSIPETAYQFGGVVIFPNPAHTLVNVRLDLNDNFANKLTFYDSFGREIFVKTDLEKGVQLVQIPVEHLPKGIYLVNIETGGQVIMTKRVVVN